MVNEARWGEVMLGVGKECSWGCLYSGEVYDRSRCLALPGLAVWYSLFESSRVVALCATDILQNLEIQMHLLYFDILVAHGIFISVIGESPPWIWLSPTLITSTTTALLSSSSPVCTIHFSISYSVGHWYRFFRLFSVLFILFCNLMKPPLLLLSYLPTSTLPRYLHITPHRKKTSWLDDK